MRIALSAALALCSVAALFAAPQQSQQSQQTPTFRSGSTIVPLDVRVLDGDGKPVTGLTARDFTVREEGVPQAITHFSFETLEPLDAPETTDIRRNAGDGLEPPKRRVILLLLGRGMLETPFNAITAAIQFVRNSLLPQDYVAVMAYNRATEFTTDHARLARVLERFKRQHGSIELRLQNTLGGLAGLVGNRRLPASLQGDVDRIFEDSDTDSGVRGVRSDPEHQDAQTRRDLSDELVRRTNIAGPDMLGPGLEQFLSSIAPTLQDAGSVLAGIEYMRFIDGEKRLIFVTEQGFALPRTEADLRIAAAASEARVAVDSIVVGGVAAAGLPSESGLTNEAFRRASSLSTMKMLSDISGGSRAATLRPNAAFARIDQATRSQYMLGYQPSNPSTDGKFKRIEVTVNRPRVSVQVRRGYYANKTPAVFDRVRVMTEMRMATAASYTQNISDLKVSVKTNVARDSEGQQVVQVSGEIDAKRLAWATSAADGRRSARLELAVLCLDERGLLVGEHRQPLAIALSPDAAEKAMASGLNYAVAVPVTSLPRHVKVIVYEPVYDLLGSEMVRLR